jgi:tetratricopeptide (TPR) repeat protein
MTTAAEWFEKGEAAVRMSLTADSTSEFRSDLAEAIEAFDQALALEPSHLGALRERGLAHARLGHHEAALDSFVAASAQAPDDAALRLAVAQSLARLEQHEAAVQAFDEVLRLSPGDEEALYGRAEGLMALRRNEAAVVAWNEVLKSKDNRTLNLHGRTVRVLTDDFRRVRALVSQALALGRLGKAEALGAFREVFDAHSTQLAGPMAPAVFHEALRELEVARTAYRAHLKATAGDPHAWKRAAGVWQAVHNSDEAIAAWDHLVTTAPDAQVWFGKAEAHAQAGQLDAAISAYERSLEYWPGFLGASARLKVIKAQKEAAQPWQVWGRDTFAREDFMVGTFPNKTAAQAKLDECEARAEKQDEGVRDEYWLAPSPLAGRGSG